ncbi:hypothetical protein PIB30_100555, partial [Stylosanthes scabra]|nr:hypothetical protein [Stylosanthes scabra]
MERRMLRSENRRRQQRLQTGRVHRPTETDWSYWRREHGAAETEVEHRAAGTTLAWWCGTVMGDGGRGRCRAWVETEKGVVTGFRGRWWLEVGGQWWAGDWLALGV